MSKEYVFISGAAGGIGVATVKALLSANLGIIAAALNIQEENELKAIDDSIITCRLDLRDEASIEDIPQALREILPKKSALKGLISNAGVD